MEGPLELAEGDGQAGEGNGALRAGLRRRLAWTARCAVICGNRSGLSKSKAALTSSCSERPSRPGTPSWKMVVGSPLKSVPARSR